MATKPEWTWSKDNLIHQGDEQYMSHPIIILMVLIRVKIERYSLMIVRVKRVPRRGLTIIRSGGLSTNLHCLDNA